LILAGQYSIFASLSNSVREATRYAIVHKEAVNGAAQTAGYLELKQKVFDYSFGIPASDIDVTVFIDPIKRPYRDCRYWG